jgi:hypothetical protein
VAHAASSRQQRTEAQLRFYKQSARVSIEAFGGVKVSSLRRAPVEDFIAK